MEPESVWILTETYNDYNQYGEYFRKVWKNKPTVSQLQELLNDSEQWCNELLTKGFTTDGFSLTEYDLTDYDKQKNAPKNK